MKVNSEVDEVESVQRWRYKDQRQENLRANVEDDKSDVKVVPEERGSRTGWRQIKAIRSDAVGYGHISDKKQSDMVTTMNKLLRQKAAPDADISIFNGTAILMVQQRR